jgi:flagellar motility protein MotE (MotC chaperone)
MKKFALPRFIRLLPAAMLATGVMLVVNGTGLVESGIALAQGAVGEAAPPKPSNQDYADSDEQIASAAQADVLTVLSRRRTELDAREAQIKIQRDILAATEKRMDAKIAQLKALETKIAGLLTTLDDGQKAQIAALVKTYAAMKPVNAARIFETMPENVLVPVAQQMKPDVLSLVLSQMNPEKAKDLTVKLANKLAMPETTDAPAPVQTAAATPAPGAAPVAAPAAAAPAATAKP